MTSGALLRGELLDVRSVEPEPGPVGIGAVAVEVRPSSSWLELAACRGLDTSWWFPQRHDMFTLRVAVAVCRGCPVRAPCLAEALAEEDQAYVFGVRGGLTASQRRGHPTGTVAVTTARRLIDGR